jgi:class III poly(R)-hydroxyalkanoic acid synthase PhaE subunit
LRYVLTPTNKPSPDNKLVDSAAMTDANASSTGATNAQWAQGAQWISAWLDSQRDWLGRWQAQSVDQRTDAMRASMETLRNQLDPQALSPEALNVVHSFQQLLHAGLQTSGEWTRMQTEQSGATWLQLPALGPAREQQQAWQTLLRAVLDYQIRWQALLALYAQVFSQSLDAVPAAVQARAAEGRPVTTLSDLYELWINCGEAAFATMAHDEAFINAQAACGNAHSHLKQAQGTLIEQWLRAHDLPTRSELNGVHQRLRDLQARVTELSGTATPPYSLRHTPRHTDPS